MTKTQELLQQLKMAIEECLETAPLDFVGTGTHSQGKEEEFDWREREARIYLALDSLENELHD